jgi:hypothetical protein
MNPDDYIYKWDTDAKFYVLTTKIIKEGEFDFPESCKEKETAIDFHTGVIYYMKDEWGNEAPYDFKNIMFKRKVEDGQLEDLIGSDTWCYTFSYYDSVYKTISDASTYGLVKISDSFPRCCNNVIKECRDDYEKSNAIMLNDIVFLNKYPIEC